MFERPLKANDVLLVLRVSLFQPVEDLDLLQTRAVPKIA